MRSSWLRAAVLALGIAGLLLIGARLPVATAGLPLSTCVAPGDGSIAAVVAVPSRFDCTTPQRSFGPGTFWLRSNLVPPARGSGPLRVRSSSIWQKRIALYALYADGRLVALDDRHDSTMSRLLFRSSLEIEVPDRHVPLRRLFWHVEDTPNLRGILVFPQLMTPDESQNNELGLTALYVGFLGLCVGLLVLNAALWIAVRSRFQLAYCAMVGSLALYALSAWGALSWMMPDAIDNANLRLGYMLLALNAVAGLWFARSFFEPHVLSGWVARAIDAVMTLLATTGAAFALLAPWHMAALDMLHGAALALQLVVTGPILWRAWARRSVYRWMFLLTWLAPAMIAWMRVANTFHLTTTIFAMRSATVVLLTIEALVSSAAIAYRIHLLGRERDDARAQEIAARTLADTDPLTGLMNRRALLAQAIGREDEQRLLLIDIDHFKRINDTIGHDGGDEVLRGIARGLRQSVSGEALVARIGGEEFAVIAPATDSPSAPTILNALRAMRMPFDLAVTASIGTAQGSLQSDVAWKRLYRRADHALFSAKAAGRDRVRDAEALPLPDAIAA